jgi:hypothetical protein
MVVLLIKCEPFLYLGDHGNALVFFRGDNIFWFPHGMFIFPLIITHDFISTLLGQLEILFLCNESVSLSLVSLPPLFIYRYYCQILESSLVNLSKPRTGEGEIRVLFFGPRIF